MVDNLNVSRDVYAEWESFVSNIEKSHESRPITLASWKHCNEFDLQADRLKYKFLSEEELAIKIRDNSRLVEICKPYLESLSLSLEEIPHIVVLADKEGWIIELRGTPGELGGIDAGLCLGSNWSEKYIGNNGIGTALRLKEPVLVHGVEHFGKVYDSYSCIGVPIINSGELLGALDISVPVQYAHPARLHILTACASSIETVLAYIKNSDNMNFSAMNNLISTAVHDLKNPLAVISGLGQLGNKSTDVDKIKSYFDRIVIQADEMNKMVTELLNVFKPKELLCQNVNPIIEEVINSYKPICDYKNIKIAFICDCHDLVRINSKLFKRSIENLINNAVQSMNGEGEISVRTKSYGNTLLITVKDTAGGIPEEMRDILFEPFAFKRSGGTGLGLFMVYYTITNTHKGKIWFETESGNGTTFSIELPLAGEMQ
ncbi:MAG: histidine kinase [Sedimentibacter sp.]|jgi:transcriptional regulator of acetoin/glycerol metabolism|nr:histidine kinase [Sedimentibacter sp.]